MRGQYDDWLREQGRAEGITLPWVPLAQPQWESEWQKNGQGEEWIIDDLQLQ